MKVIVINALHIQTKSELFEVLRNNIGYPEDYCNNLDALHDFLTEPNKKTCFVFKNLNVSDSPVNNAYQVFYDVAEDSNWLRIKVEE